MRSATTFESAFPDLYQRARGVAWRILGDVRDAEDAAAEALIRALLQWSKIEDVSYREAWVMGITVHVALDMARRRDRSPVTAALVPEAAVDGDDELVAMRSALIAALVGLPRRQREAIALVYLCGFAPGEAAAAMRLSASSVSAHLRRGLSRLRVELDDLAPEPQLLETSK